jgi:hypothetical protein
VQEFIKFALGLLVPMPGVLEGFNLRLAVVAARRFEEQVVVALGIERRVEIDEVNGCVRNVLAEDLEIVAVIELVHAFTIRCDCAPELIFVNSRFSFEHFNLPLCLILQSFTGVGQWNHQTGKNRMGNASHEVLRGAFKKQGCKRVAQELKLSLSLVHQWSRPLQSASGNAINPLDRVLAIVLVTGDLSPLEWLCARAGGRFVSLPKPIRLSPAEMLLLANGMMQSLRTLQSGLMPRLNG